MKTITAGLLAILTILPSAEFTFAQTAPDANASAPPSAPPQRSQADLEKLVAPIALYPDPLLATLLPASAYPLEIVQCARFIKDTNNIPKLDSQPWDSNVKALAQFPDIIQKMNEDLAWTSDLGQAFVDDQKAVMNAIQAMRGKAQQAGNLKTTPQQNVVVTNTIVTNIVEQKTVYVTNTVVQIQPAQPSVVYVPTYSPAVVYAPPPPGYTAAASVVSFGVGMAVGAALANDCNWGHGDIDVDVNHNVNRNVNRNVDRSSNANANRSANAGTQKWQPDSSRRTSTQSKSASAQSRGWGGQSASSANRPAASSANRSASPSTANRSASPSAANRPASSSAGASSANRQAGNRATPSSSNSRGGGGGGSAFSRSGGASRTQAASSRGSGSRGGGGGGRSGGGGGRRR